MHKFGYVGKGLTTDDLVENPVKLGA
jgi:hypothetical protein